MIDSALIAELFDRHAAALELYASQWSGNPEDCVQEAFLRLAAQRKKPDRPAAWLFRVTRNVALNDVRGESRRRHRECLVMADRAISARASSPDAAAVNEALRELDTPMREILVLRVWSELTLEETAQILSVSVSTAHRRYHQALAMLKSRLEPSCPHSTIPRN